MFIYCLNNPVNRRDPVGSISATAVKVIAKAIVGGIVNATCALATGSSFKDVALSFLTGMVQGAISEFVNWGKYAVIMWNAVDTALECYNSGVGVGSSLLAGVLTILTSLSFISECDLLTDILVDMTFGLGASLISSGVIAGMKSKASEPVINNTNAGLPNEVSSKNNQDTSCQPSISISSPSSTNWKPSYSGLGWSFHGKTANSGYLIPTVPNIHHVA